MDEGTDSELLETTTREDDSLHTLTQPEQATGDIDADLTELSDDEAASLLMDQLDKIGV